ncbi:MAG: hypothetical protein ABII09_01115 [Planctomycetota bacterium]
MLYVNDSSRVWHVAKSGNDGNGGHAGQYPVNLASDAKLTIGAAVSAAGSGDTIIIWPGDYAEAVNTGTKELSLIGTSRTKVKIAPTSGFALTIGSGCVVKNLSCIAPSSIGISCSNTTNVVIEDCYGEGPTDGLYMSQSNRKIRLLRSWFKSAWDGANLNGCDDVFAEGCVFESTGGINAGAGLKQPGGGIYRDCSFVAKASTASGNHLLGMHIDSLSSNQQIVVTNCKFTVEGYSYRTGQLSGIWTGLNGVKVVVDNCVFRVAGSSASSVVDIRANSGLAVVSGCAYNSTEGNVKVVDSAGLLTKAAKVLLNKAEQNKLTGEIQYYDDDGETPILTHTPDEDESNFTRMPS